MLWKVWKLQNINKDDLAMKEKKSMTEHTPNPFHKDADPDCLFNICIGKS